MQTRSKTPSKRKSVQVEYEVPQKKPKTPMKIPSSFKPPQNWRDLYDKVKQMRLTIHNQAPVDTMGCDVLHHPDAMERDKRFQILTALLLSSQTKDQVTADAMRRLHEHADEILGSKRGLTVEAVTKSKPDDINGCIEKVGFHNNKTKYLKQVAEILYTKYDSDIPANVDELMALPGIGPKMAYLAMNSAWGENVGIGVDTHVHRIASRFKWTPPGARGKDPEFTRAVLESWLPRDLWSEVNHLLVGLGQTVCQPRNPRCNECEAKELCPSAFKESNKPT